ncbi:MAG: hypothetical protein PHV30_02515 [Candidatus Margulisbacteria bacterium]|nr:hypothetical protein [Candidatus Margulisiibacteriota bacterium]
MKIILEKLAEVQNKKDVDWVFENLYKKLKDGIRGYSVNDMIFLGHLTGILFTYYEEVFPDSGKYNMVRDLIVDLFVKEIKMGLTDEFKNILFAYPLDVIEGIQNMKPTDDLEVILKFRKIEQGLNSMWDTQMAKEPATDEFDVDGGKSEIDRIFSAENLSRISDRTIDYVAETIQKLKDKVLPLTRDTLKKMEDDLKKLDAEILKNSNELPAYVTTRRFDEATVEEWIKVLDDEKLFDYNKAVPIKKVEIKAEKVGKQQEAASYQLKDIDEAKNKKITRDIVNKEMSEIRKDVTKKDLTRQVDRKIDKLPPDLQKTKPVAEQSVRKQHEDKVAQNLQPVKKEVLKPENKIHYDQEKVVRDLKQKHKGSRSI